MERPPSCGVTDFVESFNSDVLFIVEDLLMLTLSETGQCPQMRSSDTCH